MLRLPADPATALEGEPGLPATGRPMVILADAAGTLERRMIEEWAARHDSDGMVTDIIPIRSSRRPSVGSSTDPRLHARLSRGDDPWVVPVRIAWLPNERDGRRSVSLIDILKLGDPRDPDPIREHVILARFPHRVRIIAGAGASAGDLEAAHLASVEAITFNDFVTRRAHRALERAERDLRGNRYKVPKFLHEEILRRSDFRDGVMRLANELGMPAELALARSRYYLREIAASHSPFVIDLLANFIHWLYRQGYGSIRYDHGQIQEIARLSQEYPIAFMPSHRSNLDRLTIQFLLWENDLPPNHTAAGINMNFFPIGPLIRNTGAFFIRRSFKDNELYKFVLRSYLDYLVENRFPLEWYAEGGRSRSGKLLPPKLGMLSWVADSVMRDKAEDLYLIPTSIAYDQIMDVADYASEARGGSKKKESASWAMSAIMRLRARYGNIHVRFAEPVSIRKELGADGVDEDQLDLQKLAFEVMYRISRVTPVTPTSVVSIALLAALGEPVDVRQVTAATARLSGYIHEWQLPTTEPIRLHESRPTAEVLNQLAAHGSLSVHTDTIDPVYHLTPQQAIQAAYYRNTIVHFFVPGAIAELALLAASPDDGVEGFWAQVDRIRDLLKFEFFFSDRTRFRQEIIAEMNDIDPSWRHRLREDRLALLAGARVVRAHWAVLPFLEAYLIVAAELAESGPVIDRSEFLDACLARGHRYLDEKLLSSDESVAQPLFTSALDLAMNRGVVDGTDEDRHEFLTEIESAVEAGRQIGAHLGKIGRLL